MRRSSTVVIDEYGKVITAYTIKQGETRLLWDLQCVLEKELEPVNDAITKRLI